MVRPGNFALLNGETAMSSPKPFHVSIVDAIKQARDAHELSILAALINHTKIPMNHDTIVEAWNAKLAELGHAVTFSIVESVMAQKPDRSRMNPEERFMAEADDIVQEVFEMSDEDVQAYIKEHGLEDMVAPERIDQLLEEAMEKVRKDPRKAARFMVVWDRDKDKPKSED